MSIKQHQPVLLHRAVDALIGNENGFYLDATFGRGGHSQEILSRLGEQASLMVFDRDPAAIKVALQLQASESRLQVVHSEFSTLDQRVEQVGKSGQVDGVLLDLGVSSPQLDQAERGFSFQADGPLDMRMNPEQGMSAAEWIATRQEAEIVSVLKEYGEERFARRIAAAIVQRQQLEPITRTADLAEIVKAAIPRWEKGKHPATRSFQAIRIAVNDELNQISKGLEAAYAVLKSGGRLVVISFHSLEDRLVKRFMRNKANPAPPPRGLPIPPEPQTLKLVGKPVKASAAELDENPRARSAVLRVAEKLV